MKQVLFNSLFALLVFCALAFVYEGAVIHQDLVGLKEVTRTGLVVDFTPSPTPAVSPTATPEPSSKVNISSGSALIKRVK